ncbi:MAG: hypothetical protein LBT68_01120 [Spirochaetales bacterium]|jgi:hypothetical protein|nr:hypothetical protein [Spirochaetales bacterium]
MRAAKNIRRFFLFIALFILPPASLCARDIVITVVDADLDIPLEGAAVRSWDGETFECDAEGKVRLPAPDERQVVVRITYPGYENGRLVLEPGKDIYTLPLSLAGIMENRELVVEAQKPGTSETQSGRSVGISGRDLVRTAEIGILEDVMTSIKLLPGVGYSGSFNAMPSIRGGFPGDLTAALDGFYIERPYHWGGVASIFDPKMIESARLSHGIFSARYGHTISGLLELSSRKPSSEVVELEIGVSTSATSMNLSHPLGKDGGIALMGKVTYWDPFIWAAKQFVEEVRYVTVAPYIRSGAITAWYRFSPELQWNMSGFFGSDGIGVLYENDAGRAGSVESNKVDMRFKWDNRLGFLVTSLAWNPDTDTLIKATAGMGLLRADLDGDITTDLTVRYGDDFVNDWGSLLPPGKREFHLNQNQYIYASEMIANYQGRLDFDHDLGAGFVFAAGAQELYSQWFLDDRLSGRVERAAQFGAGTPYLPGLPQTIDGYVQFPVDYSIDVRNQGLATSGYTLLEYSTADKSFGAELGLRVDHLYFIGRDYTIQTRPVLNPRLNLDFGILKNAGAIDALNLTMGTGLFSSLNDGISYLEGRSGIDDYDLKPNRSWTSVVGTKIDFIDGLSFNIEGYYKYVFDRAYMYADLSPTHTEPVYMFNGIGHVWGFDLMLQKFTSRYWDGWISYSFNHARYKNPRGADSSLEDDEVETTSTGWFFPSFHRFHTLNLVLNLKPIKRFNIATRMSFASGVPKPETGDITAYPVLVLDADGNPQMDGGGNPLIIQKYKRNNRYSNTLRTGFSLPIDVKFSFFSFNKKGRVQSEIYFAIENLQSLFYVPKKNSSFNSYNGEENEGSDNATYEMPIPMPSFGFKWSY